MHATGRHGANRAGWRTRRRILGQPRTRENEMRTDYCKRLVGGFASPLARGFAARIARTAKRQRGSEQLRRALEAWEYEGGALAL